MDSREIDYEVFEDTAAINKFGIVKKTIKAFGCTSRAQAMRLAKTYDEGRREEILNPELINKDAAPLGRLFL